MQSIQRNFLIGLLGLALSGPAAAQSLADIESMSKEDRRNYIQSMSQDERKAMREKWRVEFEQLPPEQQQAIRERRGGPKNDLHGDRKERQEKWDAMSDAEREEARATWKAKSEERRAAWDSMSEEERAAAKEKRGKQKGQNKDSEQ